MENIRSRPEGPLRADPGRLFRLLHSYSGISTGAVIILGFASVITTGVIEWATDLPIPNNVVFVLIVGGVTFHGSAPAAVSLAILAGVARLLATGAPAARTPAAWPLAAVEGAALVALLLGFVLLARALHQAMSALQQQAIRDPLTGTLNTRGFMEVAERERRRAVRNRQALTIAYFDIDGLKKLNDGAGHQAGDRLLVRFVSAVAASIRAYDIFARLGGDEFVLALPATEQREAIGVITRIRDQLFGQHPPLSVSVGVVTYSSPAEALETMLQAADHLMYKAKQAGGNRLVGNVRNPESGHDQQIVELADLAIPR
jgi:diguanylate cyclase (GGDEF)-like protein